MPKVQVRYIVDDVDEAIRFYRDLLGLQVDMHPAPRFAIGGAHLRSDVVTGIGGKVIADHPSGKPVELFQPIRDEARLSKSG